VTTARDKFANRFKEEVARARGVRVRARQIPGNLGSTTSRAKSDWIRDAARGIRSNAWTETEE
jgi:hypothetical protein